MRGPGRIVVACFVLTLAGARPAAAAVSTREPVSGGLTALPQTQDPAAPALAPAGETAPGVAAPPAPAPERAAPESHTSWGVLARGGYFGLPDLIADELFFQHPKVSGYTYGGELRYHGEGGGRGIGSIGFAVDAAKCEGDGLWQTDKTDAPQSMGGDIEMLSFTVTGYWSLFPSWFLHPYVGLGVGVGYFKGTLQNEDDLTEVSIWLPVVHVPVGLAVELGEHLQLSLEARFLDGFAAGGALQARF